MIIKPSLAEEALCYKYVPQVRVREGAALPLGQDIHVQTQPSIWCLICTSTVLPRHLLISVQSSIYHCCFSISKYWLSAPF